MLRVRRPSAPELERLLADAKASAPTYPEVGATRGGRLPPGYRHDSDERRLGQGGEVFARAVGALRGWQAQIGAGIQVFPGGARVEDGGTVVLVLPAGGLWASAPSRVVYVDEGSGGFAFAYGTLPGHPEKGEVAFRIERDEADEIFFRVVSFSKAVDPLARLGSPIARLMQRRVTERYLRAIAEASS